MLLSSVVCKCFGRYWLVWAALSVCQILCAQEADQATALTKEQARERVAAFIGEEKMAKVRHVERMPMRGSYAPFTPILVFELTTDVANEKGEFFKATITVEETTGRILDYISDHCLRETKWEARAKPEESQLISQDRAEEIALGILEKAGTASDGMRVKHLLLKKPFGRFFSYMGACSKWQNIPDVGEVEMPVIAVIDIDALTGDLETYIYKEWPLTVKLEAPRISREQAIDLVKQANALASVSKVVDAHLCIEYDIHDLTPEQKMKQLTDAGYRFYEFQKTRQVLAWSVTLRGKLPERVSERNLNALVDAKTGLIFWHDEMNWP